MNIFSFWEGVSLSIYVNSVPFNDVSDIWPMATFSTNQSLSFIKLMTGVETKADNNRLTIEGEI